MKLLHIYTSRSIFARSSSKDASLNLVRVKSSNIWARGIDVAKDGDTTGTLYVQFKGKYGGPGDTYAYYDVPLSTYRRWLVAQSAGHFFWMYIRNNFKYAKLTGDKRGKLANAINH